MNKVIITGNLSRDPEARTTQSGITQSTFDVAVQRRFKGPDGRREADFLTVVAWRQTADFCNKYLHKGSKVAVEGSIQKRSYTAQDGSKRWVTEIIADNVESVGDREDRQTAAPKTEVKPQQQRMDYGNFEEVEDEKLPWEE